MAKRMQNFEQPNPREKSPTELILTRSKRNIPVSDFERDEFSRSLTSENLTLEPIFGSITEKVYWSGVSPVSLSSLAQLDSKLGAPRRSWENIEIEKVKNGQRRGRNMDRKDRPSNNSRSHTSTRLDRYHVCDSDSPPAPCEKAGTKRKPKKRNKEPKKSKKSKRDKYGYYGLIGESDFYNKENEFSAWLDEIQHVRFDEISPFKKIELFRDFVEDYNEARMPSRKYYDIVRWHSRIVNEDATDEVIPRESRKQDSTSRGFEQK